MPHCSPFRMLHQLQLCLLLVCMMSTLKYQLLKLISVLVEHQLIQHHLKLVWHELFFFLIVIRTYIQEKKEWSARGRRRKKILVIDSVAQLRLWHRKPLDRIIEQNQNLLELFFFYGISTRQMQCIVGRA